MTPRGANDGGTLTEKQVSELIQHTVREARPAIAKAVGDRTPRQYDKADEIAAGIARGVKLGLAKLGLMDEEASRARV